MSFLFQHFKAQKKLPLLYLPSSLSLSLPLFFPHACPHTPLNASRTTNFCSKRTPEALNYRVFQTIYWVTCLHSQDGIFLRSQACFLKTQEHSSPITVRVQARVMNPTQRYDLVTGDVLTPSR